MTRVAATVIVPTCLDRGALLPYSVGSVLRQTVHDLEVLIVGDGADDTTRLAARRLEAEDPRVRFVDRPKGPRRGEQYRHEALQDARGSIVCYLCDRDLWLPHHIETMAGLLQTHDLAVSLSLDPAAVASNTDSRYPGGIKMIGDPGDPFDRQLLVRGQLPMGLSSVAHTLAAYRALPFGWRAAPRGAFTDRYMWAQFLVNPRCRGVLHPEPTLLYFDRGDHPGWPTPQRAEELAFWFPQLGDSATIQALKARSLQSLVPMVFAARRARQRTALIRGSPPREFLGRLIRKVARVASRAMNPGVRET